MNRSLILATIAAVATAFIALHGVNEPVAQAQASEAKTIARADTAPVLPPIRFVNAHDESQSGWRALTDY